MDRWNYSAVPVEVKVEEWGISSGLESVKVLLDNEMILNRSFSQSEKVYLFGETIRIEKNSIGGLGLNLRIETRDNVGNDSLNHSEVIKMGSEFIATEETMQDILVGKFPILLIDESQDTKRELVDALLSVCEKQDKRFIVGMFGDTMQRIYTDGKENLADCIPNNWDKPAKVMNHRSTKRIVALANAVRSTIDNQSQQARSDADTGIVRLFITSSSNKEETEQQIAEMMASVTGDNNWCDETGYKSLILEHHMAASRFGFSDLYIPLKEPDVFGTALLDGTIPELSLLVHKVLPLIKAYQNNDEFGVSKIVRQHSPLLDKKLFVDCDDQIALLRKAESAINDTLNLWKNDVTPSCVDILRSLKKTGLFKLSSRVDRILDSEAEDSSDVKAIALRTALAVDLDELERYHDYVTDKTRFATHQGVKGLEFPRVMVIMDDADSRGFLFSYEKLFGAKAKTETDIKNEREGKDTSISRTTRLFYVACTRAQNSLAVVAYTESVEATKETALSNGWFAEDEIILLN
jgi:DNA helicase-2/ATP-dependent DNA helicase PcrA